MPSTLQNYWWSQLNDAWWLTEHNKIHLWYDLPHVSPETHLNDTVLIKDNKIYIWDKVFNNGPSKIFWRLSSTYLTWSIFEYFVLYGLILQFSPKVQLNETWWIIEDQNFHLSNGFLNFTQIMHFELPTYYELPTMVITRDLYSSDANSTEEWVVFAEFRGLRQWKLAQNTLAEKKDNFWRLSIPQTKYNCLGLR